MIKKIFFVLLFYLINLFIQYSAVEGLCNEGYGV